MRYYTLPLVREILGLDPAMLDRAILSQRTWGIAHNGKTYLSEVELQKLAAFVAKRNGRAVEGVTAAPRKRWNLGAVGDALATGGPLKGREVSERLRQMCAGSKSAR